MSSETDQSKRDAPEGKKAEKARVVVSVKEISCTVCAQAIEKQVKKMKGIVDVRTAVMLNKVFIDYDPKLVDPTSIRKAVDKTGFKSYMTVEETRSGS
ncbi:MAG TPA: heavy metal-associated domain-containing protein [Acidobacteriota bacterium]|nr:heavy metal-associated domain-containing protein [Acidobacteriota bacterium]